MRPIIECCVNNYHTGTNEIIKRFEDNPNYDVVAYNCVGNCKTCNLHPFILINGEFLTASTKDKLYNLAVRKITELHAWEQLDIGDEQ